MKFYSKLAQEIIPYKAGEQPLDKRYIKLNTNENPYPPSPRVKEYLSSVNHTDLRLYPDPECTSLAKTVAQLKGIAVDNIFIGNGSDEVLSMCYAAFFNNLDTIAYADITYSFYKVYADYYRLKSHIIPLKNYCIDPNDYINLNCNGIIIANPNAPTSKALKDHDIELIISANHDKIVIVDQAYIAFSEYDIVGLIDKYDNLVVVETLSKSHALAGIRCGFAFANESLISALNRIKNSINSYTINRLSMGIAEVALQDREYYEDIISKIVATRQRVYTELQSMGIEVLQSQANFLFLQLKNAQEVYAELKEKGILVRFFGGQLKNFIRVSIGTDEEMDTFLRAIKSIITKSTLK